MTEEENVLTDILGNVLKEGDTVVYPQSSGYAVQMVIGTFKGYNGKTAQIVRNQGSRWCSDYGPSPRYRDKRTGKGINPYASSLKHYKVKPTYWSVNKETGEKLTREEWRMRFDSYYEWAKWDHFSDPGEFHDYVEKYIPEPKPVSIQNVSNIVKVVSNG